MKRVEVSQVCNVFFDDETGDVLYTSSIVVADGDVESAKSACHEFEAWCEREGIEPVQGGDDDDDENGVTIPAVAVERAPLVQLEDAGHHRMAAELGFALSMAAASIRDFRGAEGYRGSWWKGFLDPEDGLCLARDLKDLSDRLDRYLD